MSDEFARTPVPESRTVGGVQIGLICIGIAITLPGLYTGGELATSLGLVGAVVAVLTGALLLSIMSVPAAIVGAKTRLSSYMIVEHVFGHLGAKFINLCFGVVLLGWYSVTAELFGRTLFLAAGQLAGQAPLPEWAFTVASSFVVILTAAFGFRAIDRLALIAVPLLFLFLSAIVGLTLRQVPLAEIAAVPGRNVDMAMGISAAVGSMIVNVILMPDLSRYARSVRACVTASFLGNGGGVIVSTVVAMIPVLAFGVIDPMRYMTILGVFGLSLVVLVFATWTTNVVNLYSTGLVAGSALAGQSYGRIVAVAGIIGTIVAVVGVADYLVPFLVVLGLVVPPVAGVYLVDYFVLGRTDYSAAHLARRPAVNVTGLLACVGGGGLATLAWFGGYSVTGIAPVESLLITAAIYWSLERLSERSGRRGTEAGPVS